MSSVVLVIGYLLLVVSVLVTFAVALRTNNRLINLVSITAFVVLLWTLLNYSVKIS